MQTCFRATLLVLVFCLFTVNAICQEPIEKFVRYFFIHGMPYSQARKFGSKDLPVLKKIISGPEEKVWVKGNSISLMGIIGSEEDFSFLKSVIHGSIPGVSCDNRSDTIMVLGYMAYHTRSKEVMNYLVLSSSQEIWDWRAVGWSCPSFISVSNRNTHITKLAILGLGLSGDRVANYHLRKMLKSHENDGIKDVKE